MGSISNKTLTREGIRIMYSTVIDIKKSIKGDALMQMRLTAEKAFSNRAGSVKNSSKEPYQLIFKGGEKDYGCLDLGVAELGFTEGFLGQVDTWKWIDHEEPDESCDVLEVYRETVR